MSIEYQNEMGFNDLIDEVADHLANEYLRVADATDPNLMLSLETYISKLSQAIHQRFIGATNVVAVNNKWGGLRYRHDAITICAMKARGGQNGQAGAVGEAK